MRSALRFGLLLGLLLACGSTAQAQRNMVHTATPFTTSSHSFFENFNTGWGFSHPGGGTLNNFNFAFGAGTNLQPQFGGFQPNSGISGGKSFGALGGRGYFNFSANQGSSSSIVNQTPGVTLTNGYTGFVTDSSQSPFVISVVPVVGDQSQYQDFGPSNTVRGRLMRGEISINERGQVQAGPVPPPYPFVADARGARQPAQPQAAARNEAPAAARPVAAEPVVATGGAGGSSFGDQPSSAETGAASLAELRQAKQNRAAAAEHEVRMQLEKGDLAKAAGKPGAAKIFYKMGLKQASGELKAELESRLRDLGSK